MTIVSTPLGRPWAAEQRLPLLIARCRLDAPALEEIRRLTQGSVDWATVFSLALSNGLAGFLARHAEHLDPPGPILDQAHAVYRENALRTWLYESELRVLGRRFDADRVDFLVLRGLGLAALLYKDPGLRGFVDLDLLVLPEQLHTAERGLASCGYREEENRHHWRKGTVLVDLHTDPFKISRSPALRYLYDCSAQEFFSRHQRVQWDDLIVPVLSCEDLLVLLSIHAVKHSFARQIWMVDLAELLWNLTPDWGAALELAGRLHSLKAVKMCLGYLEEILDIQMPEEVRRRLLQVSLSPGLGRLYQRVLQGRRVENVSLILYLSELKSLRHRVSLLWDLVYPAEARPARASGMARALALRFWGLTKKAIRWMKSF
ncbi:MAG: nucleotidyltransferase family protein [Acidobacteria bacterium]|nr:nucleotidyltransferase family protein [Acidobacteriota bacterium]